MKKVYFWIIVQMLIGAFALWSMLFVIASEMIGFDSEEAYKYACVITTVVLIFDMVRDHVYSRRARKAFKDLEEGL